jgi:hypothetical protein
MERVRTVADSGSAWRLTYEFDGTFGTTPQTFPLTSIGLSASGSLAMSAAASEVFSLGDSSGELQRILQTESSRSPELVALLKLSKVENVPKTPQLK